MNWEEDAKLVYGMLFSLKNVLLKLATRQGDNLLSLQTSMYKLFYYASISGLKFVLFTDPQAPPTTLNLLKDLYLDIYVEYAVKNPLFARGMSLSQNEAFKMKLNELVSRVQ